MNVTVVDAPVTLPVPFQSVGVRTYGYVRWASGAVTPWIEVAMLRQPDGHEVPPEAACEPVEALRPALAHVPAAAPLLATAVCGYRTVTIGNGMYLFIGVAKGTYDVVPVTSPTADGWMDVAPATTSIVITERTRRPPPQPSGRSSEVA